MEAFAQRLDEGCAGLIASFPDAGEIDTGTPLTLVLTALAPV